MSQNPVQTGMKAGFGAVFGVILAIIVIVFIIGAVNYKTPLQKWSDCVNAQYANGNYDTTVICGPEPSP